MAYLGNISICQPVTVFALSRGAFTKAKQPTPVYVDLAGSTPGNRVQLFTSAGTFIDRANVDGAGETHFYDLDDGGYNAYEVSTGNAWSITVSGTTVTVVRIASSGSPVVVYAA